MMNLLQAIYPANQNVLITKHNLDFEDAEWNHISNDGEWRLYKVGTVHGQWKSTKTAYEILSFHNDEPGNGNLEDVFQWFEYSCKRDNKDLIIREFWNKKFKQHCISKRGFEKLGKNDLIKIIARE